MTSFRQWALLSFVLTAVALEACAPSDCEQYRAWRNESSQACQSCQGTSCAAERSRVSTATVRCSAEFSCAARCPNGSDTTCGCLDACFTTTEASMACRTNYYDLIACGVRNCQSNCR